MSLEATPARARLMSSGNGFVARGEQLGGGAHPALGTWLRAALAAAALLAALGCASEPASEPPRPAATPTPTPREEAPVTKLDVTVEKFELRTIRVHSIQVDRVISSGMIPATEDDLPV